MTTERRVGVASGRLDLLGGVADYSGALVLEVPTRRTTTVILEPDRDLVVGPVTMSASEVNTLAERDYASIRGALADAPAWTHYPLGVALVLVRHGVIAPPTGRLTIESDVRVSVGVSSSAALEVATARALGADLDPLRLATLCQKAENRVVGAPCGIMDQVAVAMGTPGEVLPILCRPVSVDASIALPADHEVVGWPTHAEHDVSESPYGRARTAAFMGKKIAETQAGRTWRWVSETPPDLVTELPEVIDGAAFVEGWASVDDDLAVVDPELDYPVRAATRFGVEEHRRTGDAMSALRQGDMSALGPLMEASHNGYTAIGLGHPATDEVAARARSTPGVIGARTSGGGSGGTVVVLCRRGAIDDLVDVIR